ncbi:MAG: lipopeptide [Methylovulum sp.]|nr:MAG: lipopeptide [Methylovulum sp.]
MKTSKLLLFLLLNLILAACGQPGPLYLPDKASPAPIEPKKTTP